MSRQRTKQKEATPYGSLEDGVASVSCTSASERVEYKEGVVRLCDDDYRTDSQDS